MPNFIDRLRTNLREHNGRIHPSFCEAMLNDPNTKVTHTQVTKNTRVCVITLTTGHDLIGYAQVLDSGNDDRYLGEQVAYKDASEKIWAVLGSIAKVL